jgi:transposase
MRPNGEVHMKKKRRRYDREFKISVVAELESGKPVAQIARIWDSS